MKEQRYELRLSGSGGQGIITAALVLAEAAGTYDGKEVCQTQSYGPEVRGGHCKAEVVISDRPVDYPRAVKPDLLLAMNQASCDAYFLDLKPSGLLVVDASLVTQIPTSRVVAIPFTQMAQTLLGKKGVANTLALGAIGLLSGAVTLKSLEEALLAKVPKGTEAVNLEALRVGIEAAEKIDLKALPRSVAPEEEEI